MTQEEAQIKTPDMRKEALNQGADNDRASSTIARATSRVSDLYDDDANNSKADYSTITAGISPTNNSLHVAESLVQSYRRKRKRDADCCQLAVCVGNMDWAINKNWICLLGFIEYFYCYFCNELSPTGIAFKTKRTSQPMSPRATRRTVFLNRFVSKHRNGVVVAWIWKKLSNIPPIGHGMLL